MGNMDVMKVSLKKGYPGAICIDSSEGRKVKSLTCVRHRIHMTRENMVFWVYVLLETGSNRRIGPKDGM